MYVFIGREITDFLEELRYPGANMSENPRLTIFLNT